MSNQYSKNYDQIDWGTRRNCQVSLTFAMIPRNPNKPGFVPILFKRKAKPFVHKDVPNDLVHEDVDTIAKQINSGEFTWDQGERV